MINKTLFISSFLWGVLMSIVGITSLFLPKLLEVNASGNLLFDTFLKQFVLVTLMSVGQFYIVKRYYQFNYKRWVGVLVLAYFLNTFIIVKSNCSNELTFILTSLLVASFQGQVLYKEIGFLSFCWIVLYPVVLFLSSYLIKSLAITFGSALVSAIFTFFVVGIILAQLLYFLNSRVRDV